MASHTLEASEVYTSLSTIPIDERVQIGLKGLLSFREQVQAFSDELINAALIEYQGNQCRACRALGLHRNTLARRLDEMEERGALKAPRHQWEYKRKFPRRVVGAERRAERTA